MVGGRCRREIHQKTVIKYKTRFPTFKPRDMTVKATLRAEG